MPPFCFLSPNGEEKKRAGEKKGKKGGDELVGEGRIVSGAVVFTFSLSLARVLIAYRLDGVQGLDLQFTSFTGRREIVQV